jgi:penicillin amidase
VYADELGEAFQRNWSSRPTFLEAVLEDRSGQARWCDDVRTPAPEACGEIATAALDAALADLRARFGIDPVKWRWGAAHVAHHQHRPFSRVAWLAPFFDIEVETPGDAYSVNAGRSDFDQEAPFANRHASSLRALYDLADPQASLFIHSGGQSGNPLSRHYRGYTQAWARGEYLPMVTDRARIEAGGAQRLVLVPRK